MPSADVGSEGDMARIHVLWCGVDAVDPERDVAETRRAHGRRAQTDRDMCGRVVAVGGGGGVFVVFRCKNRDGVLRRGVAMR
jgi:hypothetical protein